MCRAVIWTSSEWERLPVWDLTRGVTMLSQSRGKNPRHVTGSRAGRHIRHLRQRKRATERGALKFLNPLSFVYLSTERRKEVVVSYPLPTCRPRPRWAPCCGSGWVCCCCSRARPRPPPVPYHIGGGARCSRGPRPSGRRSHRQSASFRKPRTRNTTARQFHVTSIKKVCGLKSNVKSSLLVQCIVHLSMDFKLFQWTHILCKWGSSIEQQVGAVSMKLFVPEDGRFSSVPSSRSHLCWTEAGIYHTCGQTVSHNPENDTIIF